MFKNSLNSAVFTTKFVLEEKKTITYVSHDLEDGAWQFLSDDKFENYEEVTKIISLQEIIELDNSVLELADLPLGYYSIRADKNETWKTYKQE